MPATAAPLTSRQWRACRRCSRGSVSRWTPHGTCPEAEALAVVAETSSFPIDTLTAHWRQCLGTDFKARKWRRDREIMRLAWAGKSNREIGIRSGLSQKYVSALIARKLRSGRALEPGAPSPLARTPAPAQPALQSPQQGENP